MNKLENSGGSYHTILLSSDDEDQEFENLFGEIEHEPLVDRIKKKDLQTVDLETSSPISENFATIENLDEPATKKAKGYENRNGKSTTKKTQSERETDKELKRLEKEAEKRKKQEERARKKEELERDKALKQALVEANKNIKREECLKFITVHINQNILDKEYGNCILECLRSSEISYKTGDAPNLFPNLITWTRMNQMHFINDNGQLTMDSNNEEVKEVLYIMNWDDFIDHVHENTLIAHILSLESMLNKKKFTLVIYQLNQYFKYEKSLRNATLRAELGNNFQLPKKFKSFSDIPKVSRNDIDVILTELQIVYNCSHRMVNKAADIGMLVFEFTKSIAQIPYKQKKEESYQKMGAFLVGDNRDCVKVDSNGNGLRRLWQQILTTFPLARLETAEAIISNYPSPSNLIQAYRNCSSQLEAEQLLQDIPVRRAAGPLTNIRKIGPELSKKIYLFFNSLEGDVLI